VETLAVIGGPVMTFLFGVVAAYLKRLNATMNRVETVIGKNGGGTLFELVAKNHNEARGHWALLEERQNDGERDLTAAFEALPVDLKDAIEKAVFEARRRKQQRSVGLP
jgi:hypothetical protein